MTLFTDWGGAVISRRVLSHLKSGNLVRIYISDDKYSDNKPNREKYIHIRTML
jgi:hypothetical protein